MRAGTNSLELLWANVTSADSYLLQVQPYELTSVPQKPKTEGAAIKADGDQSSAGNTVTPATGQKEAVPHWYDVDQVKGTQFTVTGYSVPVDMPTDGEQVGSVYNVNTCNTVLTKL